MRQFCSGTLGPIGGQVRGAVGIAAFGLLVQAASGQDLGNPLLRPPAAPQAQAVSGDELVSLDVAVDRTALTPGATVHLGVILDVADGWHIYWRNAGDTGIPVALEVEAPEWIEVGDVRWPAPQWYQPKGGITLDYVHEGRPVLVLPLRVAEDAPLGDRAEIAVAADWLVCKESCLFGDGEKTIALDVAEASEAANQELFRSARAAQPKTLSEAAAAGVRWAWEGDRLVVRSPGAERLTFFAYESDEGVEPANPRRDARAKADVLRIAYPPEAAGARGELGVVVVEREGAATAYVVDVGAGDAE